MASIKRFFEKKKLDTKFKQAGSGHKLNENVKQQLSTDKINSKPAVKRPPSAGAARAGEAAFLRLQQQKQQTKKPASNTATWKHKSDDTATAIDFVKMKQDVTATYHNQNAPKPSTAQNIVDENSILAVEDVLFVCPVCPCTLPRPAIYEHLKGCLEGELSNEPLMISVAMIYTLNSDPVKVEQCIHILCKYLQNIIDHPSEEKYRKIRKGNKVFFEKVLILHGVSEFLSRGCGFELKLLPMEDKDGTVKDEEFFVLSEDFAKNTEQLVVSKELLTEAEPLEIKLDRNMKVFEPSTVATNMEVPASFYSVSSAEIKQDQSDKTAIVDKMTQLRTRAMREGDQPTTKKIFKFLVVRIRFPDGLLLQGTFRCSEKISDVKSFIQENLCLDWLPFTLCNCIGRAYSDESATLSSLKLAPAALLTFAIDEAMKNEIASSSSTGTIKYLSDECLLLIQTL